MVLQVPQVSGRDRNLVKDGKIVCVQMGILLAEKLTFEEGWESYLGT